MTTVKDIYGFIDKIAPYALQEGYDNSGLNVGNLGCEVKKAVIALDITKENALEAKALGADLIVTHHPVIFKPLKAIDSESIFGILLINGISALSAHTNFDSAVMNKLLCEKLGLVPKEPIAVENGAEMGCICETDRELTAEELAKSIKESLGNCVVRYNGREEKISRIAVCSGSGGSFLRNVIAKDCGAFITGDVKHDIFIDANNAGLCVFDAGHFHTENIFCEYMLKALSERFSDVEFKIAHSNKDILSYEI